MLKKSSAAMAAFGLAFLGFAPAALAGSAEKVLYTFNSGYGGSPTGGLVGDETGNLYGTIEFTGAGFGVVYRLSPNAKGGWTYSVIHSFTGGPDGANPEGLLTFDSAGNLYGTTVGGGPLGDPSLGAVFELSPSQDGSWSVARTYAFTGYADGSVPRSGVVVDESGNVYGTASEGGVGYNDLGYGTVFELTPSGGTAWTETTVHEFTYGGDGGYPSTNLTLDRKHNIYGSVQYGGTGGTGYVFEFHPSAKGWKGTDIHDFGDGDAGGTSYGSLVLDSAGNIYGTTALYNQSQSQLNGSVFELSKPSPGGSQSWPVTTLYQLTGGASGGEPTGLLFDKQGDIYVNSATSGASQNGAIYKLTPSVNNGQTTWTASDLYDFAGGNDGCRPGPNVIFDKPSSGRLYGVTDGCGANLNGTVYSLKK